jgi:hypothetical protein
LPEYSIGESLHFLFPADFPKSKDGMALRFPIKEIPLNDVDPAISKSVSGGS